MPMVGPLDGKAGSIGRFTGLRLYEGTLASRNTKDTHSILESFCKAPCRTGTEGVVSINEHGSGGDGVWTPTVP